MARPGGHRAAPAGAGRRGFRAGRGVRKPAIGQLVPFLEEAYQDVGRRAQHLHAVLLAQLLQRIGGGELGQVCLQAVEVGVEMGRWDPLQRLMKETKLTLSSEDEKASSRVRPLCRRNTDPHRRPPADVCKRFGR